jgi:hypothetical protein
MRVIMLISVRLSDRWTEIERELPPDWGVVQLRVRPEQAGDLAAVARVLGSLGAGRVGDELAVTVARTGSAAGPAAVRRTFALLDDARTWCRLELGQVEAAEPRAAAASATSLPAAWDHATAALPRDWSDLLCRIRLESSALLDRGALLCAPLNPAREPDDLLAFTFRVARRAGYGASPAMVRRCLERLEAEAIEAEVTVLRQLSETDRVATQGPVWLVGDRHL